jgi:hypothetical protein
MKCWCFNQEQLDRALAAYRQRIGDPRDRGVNDPFEAVITSFLDSLEAREHKLTLDGMWDRKEPPPAPLAAPPIPLSATLETTAAPGIKEFVERAERAGFSCAWPRGQLVTTPVATPTGTLDPRDDAEERN